MIASVLSSFTTVVGCPGGAQEIFFVNNGKI